MIVALLLAAALLQDAPPAHGPEPGARTALAGIAGFQSVSRLDFGPGLPHNRLTAVYAFPDRARWHFENYDAVERSEHVYLYRHGETVTHAAGGPSESLDDPSRALALLQLELRRATMLWPDGFEWTECGDGARAAPVHRDSCCREGAVGRLVATLADGRPLRIEARDADDRVVETLEIREWQEREGRTWPRTLALVAEGGGFVETIESVETRVHYLELSFVPPDRRSVPADGARDARAILPLDVVAVTYSARELPPDCTWDAALERARVWIAESAAELGPAHAVDPVPTFEVSDQGHPVRCLVRLAVPVRPAPAGFRTEDDRPGFLLTLERVQGVDAVALARLRRAVPAGARASAPYVRVHERTAMPVELVLPLSVAP